MCEHVTRFFPHFPSSSTINQRRRGDYKPIFTDPQRGRMNIQLVMAKFEATY